MQSCWLWIIPSHEEEAGLLLYYLAIPHPLEAWDLKDLEFPRLLQTFTNR